MVAKCPTRTKDKLKENNKAKASPYPVSKDQKGNKSDGRHSRCPDLPYVKNVSAIILFQYISPLSSLSGY